MFIVTIEQAVDDDFFGHWIQCAAWALQGTNPEQAMYEALHRWIKDAYHDSTEECLLALGIDDNELRVKVSYACPPASMVTVWRERFTPLDAWAGGRYISKAPVHCVYCGWYGPMAGLSHRYRLNSQWEIEPIDHCPGCDAILGGL